MIDETKLYQSHGLIRKKKNHTILVQLIMPLGIFYFPLVKLHSVCVWVEIKNENYFII